MKSLNKKLYSVIIVCLLLLCFTVGVMANNGTESSVSGTSSGQNTGTPSGTGSGTEGSSDTNVSGANSSGTDSNATGSGETGSGEISSEETVSGESSNESTTESDESGINDGSSYVESQTTTSYTNGDSNNNNNNYQGNIGGEVIDEADTSGWGGDNKKPLVSAGTTKKKANKNITDFSKYLWIALYISLVFIAASITGLVVVNRKSFLNQMNNHGGNAAYQRRNITASDRQKRKNNHKNRTNIYRPRD